MPDASESNWPSRLEWMLIVGAWTTVALFTAANMVLAPRGGGGVEWSHFPVALGRELFEHGFWIVLTPVIFWLAGRFSLERPHLLRNAALHLGAAVLVAITIELTDGLLRMALFAGPDEAFRPAAVLQFIVRLWFVNELIVYFVVLGVGFARDYYLQKKRRQEEAERLQERNTALQKQLTEARLEALRMQLNPHFLFNTLHAINTLVGPDQQDVRRMVTRLSELLRRVLDEEAPQEIPLSEELDMLDDYLEIQQIRFQDQLDVSVHVLPDLRDAHVPYLILQPLAENAIKHGASRVRGTGRIAIDGRRENDHLVLTVWDNGPGLDADFEPGIGLRNVEARLEGLYGAEYDLRVEPAEDGRGVTATLRLPYHTGTDLYAPESQPLAEPTDEVVFAASAPDHSEDTSTEDHD